ncbi:hypothetical protein [Marichromatium bheemlicum]|uniref:Uncharacterized protein n=1 Tax=Marichromatium bheemlicum TaxID=365339 RepID=A0ABX1I9K0_9GAMM|nr:hypothetical protein [Marichromatium bheemlicum]NKN34228.1 hypothetical protein [Marichromatium bheemlicum]
MERVGGAAGERIGAGLGRVAEQAKDVVDKLQEATDALTGLTSVAAGIEIGFAAIDALKDVAAVLLDAGMRAQDLRSDLIFAAGGLEEADAVMRALRVTADDLGVRTDELAQAWIRLKNLGLDPSREALEAYANIAAGNSGKSIMDFVEAVADASEGQFDRLKAFGIRATDEGERVALTFKGTMVEVENDARAIQGALREIAETEFSGALEARSGNASTALDSLNESVGRLTASLAENSGLVDKTSSLASAFTELSDALAAPSQRPALTGMLREIYDSALAVNNPIGLINEALGRMGVTAEATVKGAAGMARALKDIEAGAETNTGVLADHSNVVEDNTSALLSAEDVVKAYAVALADLVDEHAAEVTAAEHATEQLEGETDLRADHLQHLVAEARARGDEAEALRLEAEVRAAAIDGITALIDAKEQELAAQQRLLAVKRAATAADGEITQQEQAKLATQQATVEGVEAEIASMREQLRHRQMLADIGDSAADTTRTFSDSQRDLGNSAKVADEGIKKVVGSSNDLNIAFLNSREQIRNAIADLRGYSSAAADAVEEIVGSIDRWDNKIRAIEALEASDFVGDGADEASARIAQLEAELEATAETADQLAERVDMAFNYLRDTDAVVLAITQLKQEVIEAEIAVERLAQQGERLQAEFTGLADALDAGSIGLSEYAGKLDRLINANQRLGEEELEPLRAALDDARRKMDALTQSAEDGLNQWRAKLYEIQGQQTQLEEMNWRQDRLETERALAEARRNGNREEIAALREQLHLIDQYYEIKTAEARQAERAAAAEQAAAQSAESRAAAATASAPSTGNQEGATPRIEPAARITPDVAPARTVRHEVVFPGGFTASVEVAEAQSANLEAVLRQFETAAAVAAR